MTKRQRKINDLQNTTQKTKDRATRTALKPGDELGCSGRVGSSCSTRDTRCITLDYVVCPLIKGLITHLVSSFSSNRVIHSVIREIVSYVTIVFYELQIR
jgi:hypothetical protein